MSHLGVASWLRERCEDKSTDRLQSSVGYLDYLEWCADTGQLPMKLKAFSNALVMAGFERREFTKGTMFLGLRLKSDKEGLSEAGE